MASVDDISGEEDLFPARLGGSGGGACRRFDGDCAATLAAVAASLSSRPTMRGNEFCVFLIGSYYEDGVGGLALSALRSAQLANSLGCHSPRYVHDVRLYVRHAFTRLGRCGANELHQCVWCHHSTDHWQAREMSVVQWFRGMRCFGGRLLPSFLDEYDETSDVDDAAAVCLVREPMQNAYKSCVASIIRQQAKKGDLNHLILPALNQGDPLHLVRSMPLFARDRHRHWHAVQQRLAPRIFPPSSRWCKQVLGYDTGGDKDAYWRTMVAHWRRGDARHRYEYKATATLTSIVDDFIHLNEVGRFNLSRLIVFTESDDVSSEPHAKEFEFQLLSSSSSASQPRRGCSLRRHPTLLATYHLECNEITSFSILLVLNSNPSLALTCMAAANVLLAGPSQLSTAAAVVGVGRVVVLRTHARDTALPPMKLLGWLDNSTHPRVRETLGDDVEYNGNLLVIEQQSQQHILLRQAIDDDKLRRFCDTSINKQQRT